MRNRFGKMGMLFMLIIMAVIIATTAYADSALPQSKEDIPSEWAETEIVKAIEINLVPQNIQGEYRVNITREEFSGVAVSLYEAISGKEGMMPKENPFSDTQTPEVMIANNLGIVQGAGDGTFAPDDEITREQISVMLYRTLQAAKPGYNYPGLDNYIFDDYDRISPWAREAVNYLYGIEVINGVGENLFNPGGSTSREEAIVLAKRMNDKVLVSKDNLVVSRAGTSRREIILRLKLEELLAQEMGKPYKWGGTGPNSYDCSGLVYSVYGKLGISLPRTASSQAKVGTKVDKEDLEYGDLVFFARDGKSINHVGIYAGDGEMIHAPQTGDVVKRTTIMSGYYQRCYYTAKRVIS